VNRNRAALIQRVTSVMPIVDELNSKGMIHAETYAEIRAERTNQEKMRKLFEALEAGGDRVKYEFYHALKIHEQFLFRDLGTRIYSWYYEIINSNLYMTCPVLWLMITGGGTENTAGDNREQNLSERMQLQ